MPWFNKSSDEGGEGIEFKPEEFQKTIETSVNSKFDELKNEMSPVLEFVNQQKENARLEKERKDAEEQSRRNQQPSEQDYILNPDKAVRQAMQPLAESHLRLAARMAKQDVLTDQEYYTGDIKSKVDEMIAQQPLDRQADPSVILNVYKIVAYDHRDKIADGTIKSKASAASFSSSGTGGHSGSGENNDPMVLSAEEKAQAAKFGMSEKDWAESKKELEYV